MSNKIYSLSAKTWVENQEKEFFESNGTSEKETVKMPVVFCVDTGRNMFKLSEDGEKTKIAKIQETIQKYIETFSSPDLKDSVDYSIVTFSDDVGCEKSFSTAADSDFTFDLSNNSYSAIGSGVNLSVNLLESKIEEYKENGIEYTSPFLFIFFGSNADSEDPTIGTACEKISELTEYEDLNVFPVNSGDADMETLGKFFSESTFQKFGDIDLEKIFDLSEESDEETEIEDENGDFSEFETLEENELSEKFEESTENESEFSETVINIVEEN